MPDINEAKTKEKSIDKKEKSRKKRFEGLTRFFAETKAEFRKVVWPTPQTTFNQTVVVLLAIVIIGVFIWAIDTGSTSLVSMLLKK